MLANAIAYILARRWRPQGIYEALLAQDGVVLPEEAPRPHALEVLTVADAMTAPVVAVAATSTVADVAATVATSGRSFSVVPIVDELDRVRGGVRMTAVREAVAKGEGGQPIASIMQPLASIGSDEPLLHAVVRFNDLGARQLAVVDGTQLVGMLVLSDLLRAHARAAPTLPDATAARTALTAEQLLVPTARCDGATPFAALVDEVTRSAARAVVVTEPDGRCRVVLVEQLQEPANDDRLRALLVASDLAITPAEVRPSTDLPELIRQTAPGRPEAALVVDEAGRLHGVVTRAAIANALFERYASRLAAR